MPNDRLEKGVTGGIKFIQVLLFDRLKSVHALEIHYQVRLAHESEKVVTF